MNAIVDFIVFSRTFFPILSQFTNFFQYILYYVTALALLIFIPCVYYIVN